MSETFSLDRSPHFLHQRNQKRPLRIGGHEGDWIQLLKEAV